MYLRAVEHIPQDELHHPDRVYCYIQKPFGLRNAGATFTRLIHSALETQLGHNVEAYIDNIVIKSKVASDHVTDLRETFASLWRGGIKLNPEKCTFGATRGKLLGYQVSKRGIEANSEKIKAIIDMSAPRTPKEVQHLTGRLAALSRFLAKSVESCLPLFAVLRGASPFRWTVECQQVFEGLNEHLSKLAALVTPPPGQGLLLYLSTSPVAVSAVLVLEDYSGARPLQRSVYYVSEALTGSKTHYTELEKIAYALVMASRKLRHYFLAHDIMVLTSYPLGNMLRNKEATGWIGKWAVELASFAICFVARSAIKSQVLADFIAEWTRPCSE